MCKTFFSLTHVINYKLLCFRAITVSGLRKTSTTAEEKKEQEQDGQSSEAELKEQCTRLTEEVKQLKEKNEDLLVS